MRAVDTDVLLRLLLRDEPRQTAAALRFVEEEAWISTAVLLETAWVLSSRYERTPAAIAAALETVLGLRWVAVQEIDAAAAALALFRQHPRLGFSDCYIAAAARQAGHLPLGTFDRMLTRLPGAQEL